jgi:hypothetical protein
LKILCKNPANSKSLKRLLPDPYVHGTIYAIFGSPLSFSNKLTFDSEDGAKRADDFPSRNYLNGGGLTTNFWF